MQYLNIRFFFCFFFGGRGSSIVVDVPLVIVYLGAEMFNFTSSKEKNSTNKALSYILTPSLLSFVKQCLLFDKLGHGLDRNVPQVEAQ